MCWIRRGDKRSRLFQRSRLRISLILTTQSCRSLCGTSGMTRTGADGAGITPCNTRPEVADEKESVAIRGDTELTAFKFVNGPGIISAAAKMAAADSLPTVWSVAIARR